MNKEEMECFRQLILKKKRDLLSQLGYLKTINDNPAKTSSNPFHVEDEVSDTIDREVAFTLAHREKMYLRHLNHALERIDNGTYGACQTCGEDINKPRLEAVPHATQCVKCQNSEEKRRRGL
ncbi:MAG: TraR/DksA family transcriptional regulator [Candidatus Latescibacterota bacterium]